MKKVLFLSLAFFATTTLLAQLNPVKWSHETTKIADGEYEIVFTAHVADGWYIYSQNLESDAGPIPTSFAWKNDSDIEIVGATKEGGTKIEGYDELFDMNVIKYSGQPTFTQRIKANGPTTFPVDIEFMTCDKERCLPPTIVKAKVNLL